MNRNRALDLWVGLFVALGFAALLFLALKAANASSFSADKTYTLKARFDNIGGLKVRAPVKSAGVVVGRVTDIGLDHWGSYRDEFSNVSGRWIMTKRSVKTDAYMPNSFFV